MTILSWFLPCLNFTYFILVQNQATLLEMRALWHHYCVGYVSLLKLILLGDGKVFILVHLFKFPVVFRFSVSVN